MPPRGEGRGEGARLPRANHAPHATPPVTPDGRYLVVRGRLWRRSNPSLGPRQLQVLVEGLMHARSAVGRALRAGDATLEREARARVHRAKVALGERGPPWWTDGTPDYTRHLVKNSPYAAWYAALGHQ